MRFIKILCGFPVALLIWPFLIVIIAITTFKYRRGLADKKIRMKMLEGNIFSVTFPFQFIKDVWSE